MKAKEMLEISNANSEETVIKKLLEKCKKVASNGKTSIRVREFNFGEYKIGDFQEEIIKELRKNGYKSYHTCDFGSFADCYLYIGWSEDES